MQLSTRLKNFPFQSVLSLRMLIDYWKESPNVQSVPGVTDGITQYLSNAPELNGPITDFTILEKHRSFVNFLMAAVMPPANAVFLTSSRELKHRSEQTFPVTRW
jgi:hypothetical protein